MILCVSVCAVCASAGIHVEPRGQLLGVSSLFPLRVPGFELRLSGFCGKYFYLLRHLLGPFHPRPFPKCLYKLCLNSLGKQSWKTTIEQKVWLSHASPLAVLTTTDLLQLILYFVFLYCRTGLSLCFEEQSVVGLEGFREVTPDVFGVLFRHLVYSFSCISCL